MVTDTMRTINVDADSHILEPADLWEKDLPLRYRERALRIKEDEHGLEYLEIDGKKSLTKRGGILANQAGSDIDHEDVFTPGKVAYEEAAARVYAARDPHARIQRMDEERIDITILYPSLGLGWEGECDDPDLASAYCRVYNDWLLGFCGPYPDRLIPNAHVSLLDIGSAVGELERCAKLGARGVFLSAAPATGIPYGEDYYDPFWAAAQEMEIPVGIHVIMNPNHVGSWLMPQLNRGRQWYTGIAFFGDVQLAFTSLFCGGVFDRFPRLKVVLLETGCTWIPHWLDYMDARYNVLDFSPISSRKPSEYWDSNCWASMEPEETAIEATVGILGSHKLMWASDYPHGEGHAHPLEEVLETLKPLKATDAKSILGTTATDLYKLR